jgi:hypothetical protein
MTGKRLAVKTPMDSNNHEEFHKAIRRNGDRFPTAFCFRLDACKLEGPNWNIRLAREPSVIH